MKKAGVIRNKIYKETATPFQKKNFGKLEYCYMDFCSQKFISKLLTLNFKKYSHLKVNLA